MEKPRINLLAYPKQQFQKREPGLIESRDREPMAEVKISREVNNALDHYRKMYEKKYGSQPVFASLAAATTTMKDILRKVQPEGLPRVLAMTTQYLLIDNEYYQRRGHCLELFSRDIQAISAATKPLILKSETSTVLISFTTSCPQCRGSYEVICKSDEMDKRAYTELCNNCK